MLQVRSYVTSWVSALTLREVYTSSRPSVEEVREEYGKWLSSVFGQVPQVGLGTYTFRDPPIRLGRPVVSIGRQYASRAAKQLEFLLTANGSSCFITLEEGSLTRRLHLHSLETSDPRMRELIHRQWGRRYGFESYRDVRSKMAVSLYVAKYVTKSDLPFWAGGPLFESWGRK